MAVSNINARDPNTAHTVFAYSTVEAVKKKEVEKLTRKKEVIGI